jgi:hypothetical protein
LLQLCCSCCMLCCRAAGGAACADASGTPQSPPAASRARSVPASKRSDPRVLVNYQQRALVRIAAEIFFF